MKIKTTFVTNSSSASFMIQKHNLTQLQIDLIYNHIEVGATVLPSGRDEGRYIHFVNDPITLNRIAMYSDEWKIKEDENTIEGYTGMDNFDMFWYLTEVVGIKGEDIDYDHSNF